MTNTVAESIFEHPFASVPITVKVEVEVKVKEIEVVVAVVLHEYKTPPLAVSVDELPMQILLSAPALTTGS